MNIVLINFSGNVGKSTLTQHLFLPRIPNVKIIPIESINSSAIDKSNKALRGQAFDTLMTRMSEAKYNIIDVGASNVEEFILQMQDHEGSVEDFDHFIVPTVSDNKQQADTWETIRELNRLGVSPNNISVIFNRIHRHDAIDDKFDYLLQFHSRLPFCRIDHNWLIRENELFSKIKNTSLSITELAQDPADYKALSRACDNMNEKIELITKLGIKRLSQGVNRNFDTLFTSLDLRIVDE